MAINGQQFPTDILEKCHSLPLHSLSCFHHSSLSSPLVVTTGQHKLTGKIFLPFYIILFYSLPAKPCPNHLILTYPDYYTFWILSKVWYLARPMVLITIHNAVVFRWYAPAALPKCWYLCTELCDVKCQRNATRIHTFQSPVFSFTSTELWTK